MFEERLKELLKETNSSPAQLSKSTGLPLQTISNWLNRGSIPAADKIVLLADFFEVSTDYLLGREADTGIIQTNANLAPIEENILILLRKLSKTDQYKVLGYVQALAS